MEQINDLKFASICKKTFLIFVVVMAAFYFIAEDGIRVKEDSSKAVTATSVIGEMHEGTTIQQDFVLEQDRITSLTLYPTTYNRLNTGELTVEIIDKETEEILNKKSYDISVLMDNAPLEILQGNIIDLSGTSGQYDIFITTKGTYAGNGLSFWYSPTEVKNGTNLSVNGVNAEGEICFDISYEKDLLFGEYYWYIASVAALLAAGYLINANKKFKQNKKSFFLLSIVIWHKYNFLIKQLVARDFKGKYKRSVLGFIWSFLNPLLTMSVQYIIFSTVFKTEIAYFPVYLMIGVVWYSFFSESVSMGLVSIIGNAGLITKVYVPKYIYPFTRVVSSMINLLLSLIPLMIVIVLSGLKLSLVILLVPFSLITLFVFCLGMAMLLSASMVFFRDTQFLWGVFSLMWMYATPIFYPETILPANLEFIFKINPMYHYIRFARIIVINGISPEPKAYLYCILFSLLSFFVGAYAFKKTQDKFVMYL